jgi:hypothetical protein
MLNCAIRENGMTITIKMDSAMSIVFLCLGGNDPGMDTNRKMHKEKSEEKIRRNNAMLS